MLLVKLIFSINGLNTILPLKAKDEQSQATVADLFATTLSCDAIVIGGSAVKKVDEQTRNVMQPPSTVASALRYAGVRHDVMSIWPSNNQSQEIIDFYKEQLSGVSPVIALRRAELSQVAHNAHPAEWASLQIFGPLY